MGTWAHAAPAFLVLLAVVLVPGAAMAYAVGLRGLVACALAPSLGFTSLTISPIVAHLVSVDWSPSLLVAFSLGWVGVAALAGIVLRLAREAAGRPLDPMAPLDSVRTLAVAGGSVVLGVVLVLWASLGAIGDPAELVDSTDVVAHLNRIRAFLDTSSLSSIGAPSTYPSGFHDLAASTMQLLPGLDIVEAANLTALAAAAVFFPLGCVVLTRLVVDCRPLVLVAAGLASSALSTFPFILMGWGVLWPNLLATALLPGVLGPALVATGVVRVDDGTGRHDRRVSRATTGLGVLGAVPGFTLCHPNGLVALVMFVVVGLVVVRAQRLRRPGGDRRALVEGAALVVGTLVVLLVLPRVSQQVADTMSYAPSSTTSVLPALREIGLLSLENTGSQLGVTLLAVVGLVVCWRRAALRWVVVVEALCVLLYVLAAGSRTAAGDLLTGYWYNDKYRLAALAAVPLLLLLVAAVDGIADVVRGLLARRARGEDAHSRRLLAPSGAAALVVLVLLTVGLSHSTTRALIGRYYHPKDPTAVLLSTEQAADLATLATFIPATVVTADVPANGSALLYALDHRKVLFDSLLLNPDPDSALIGLHLKEATTRPDVCAALRRADVQYAITGAVTYRLNLKDRTTGMDDLVGAPGFTLVAAAGRYRLWRIDACGFGSGSGLTDAPPASAGP